MLIWNNYLESVADPACTTLNSILWFNPQAISFILSVSEAKNYCFRIGQADRNSSHRKRKQVAGVFRQKGIKKAPGFYRKPFSVMLGWNTILQIIIPCI